ncbi:MAG TPA: SDR family NAD(P)-dependent oxidoreductase [Myxococcales bacterium]|jgi:NAD(P)-dependent dehydrogenase (short-subunit alcohol dehydrogenase family)
MKPVCAVVGIGPGNGAALARRFDRDGYAVALLSRSTGLSSQLAAGLSQARAVVCDAADAASVERAFEEVRTSLGQPEVVVYNAGAGLFGGFADVTAQDFENAWRVNALGSFLVAKQTLPAMEAAGRGSFVFIGATASLRGTPRATAFAPAKAAQRIFAQSLARQLGPKGVHVSLIIVDGVVDLPRTRARMPDKPDSFFIRPDDVAAAAAMLVGQPKSTWTFELEVRPFGETW